MMNILRKTTSLVLVCAMLMSAIPVFAGWDGYTADEDSTLTIVSMNNFSKITNAGAKPTTKQNKSSGYTAKWDDHPNVNTLAFTGVHRDWTEYSSIEFWCYSEVADNARFAILIDCDKEEAAGDSYYMGYVDVDWKGWKKVAFALNGLSCTRNAKFSKVNRIRFRNTGWSGLTNYESTCLYIDDIVLRGIDKSMSEAAQFVFDYDALTNFKTERLNTTFLFAGFEKSMTGDKKTELSTTPQAIDGTVFSGKDFFEKTLDANVSENGEKVTVKTKTHTISFELGKEEYTLNGESKSFITPPKKEENTLLLPAAEIATALGYDVVCDGKLVVIGENAENFADNEDLRRIAAYLLTYEEVNPKDFTSEDFKVLKDKWREQLVGTEANDVNDEIVKAKLDAVGKVSRSTQQTMVRGTKDVTPWGDKMVISDDMGALYKKIYNMALGYATPGTETYKDKQLLDDLIYALEWGYENAYGDDEMANKGWRDTTLHNWYHWQIATPLSLVQILILLEDELDKEFIEKSVEVIRYFVPKIKDYGSNLIHFATIIVGYCALIEDGEHLMDTVYGMDVTMAYVKGEKGQGFHNDGTYIFHTRHFHVGSYGMGQYQYQSQLLSMLNGTKFEVQNPEKEHLVEWAFNTFEPVTYNGGFMAMACGRSPGSAIDQGYVFLEALVDVVGLAEGEDLIRLKTTIKRMANNIGATAAVKSLRLPLIPVLRDILADETIPENEPYIKAKVYNEGDKAVHHNENFTASVAMSSSRVFNYECINATNMDGWYMGDGMTYYYSKQNRQYDSGWWTSVNKYKMPGTTVDTQKRQIAAIKQGNEYLSSKDFVGGTTLNNTCSAVAMDLESYHNEIGGATTDTGNGAAAPKHSCSLVADKGWFMFDDEVVALGSEINANDDVNVLTVVDNRRALATNLVSSASVKAYDLSLVEASIIEEDENLPEHTIDKKNYTRWSAQGDVWITYDLGDLVDVGFVTVAFYSGDKRYTKFDIALSEDGVNWNTAFKGNSSGTTTEAEIFPVDPQKARYVKIIAHGNSLNAWNSISEVNVYPSTPSGTLEIESDRYVAVDKLFVNGIDTAIEDAEDHIYENTSYVWLENFGGYIFPKKETLSVKRTGNSASFTEMWIDHGVNPVNEEYSYIVLPNKTQEEIKAYSENPDAEILENSGSIQSVYDKSTNTYGIIFREKGTFKGITTDKPLIVMFSEADGKVKLSVADPTHKLTEATIKFTGKMLEMISSDREITLENNALKINFEGSDGKTFIAECNIK